MTTKNHLENLVVYTSKNKDIKLQVSFDSDTVWLSQEQMTKLFGR